ncbi:hypothetical protein BDN70DRAFT_28130 [Pholiota conissans]|uniref:Uncharacterized protein n=1 Tax=Pholiota conissans TaxID=109636 RepID=A0A9P6CY79_9AGAR|nr:hypothetical protein BDN70DRAFT_28130 [Pholiota conissans]
MIYRMETTSGTTRTKTGHGTWSAFEDGGNRHDIDASSYDYIFAAAALPSPVLLTHPHHDQHQHDHQRASFDAQKCSAFTLYHDQYHQHHHLPSGLDFSFLLYLSHPIHDSTIRSSVHFFLSRKPIFCIVFSLSCTHNPPCPTSIYSLAVLSYFKLF